MFKIDEKDYELKFNLTRIGVIEDALGKSLVAALAVTDNCQMAIKDIRTIFGYSLKEVGADTFVVPKTAKDLCDAYMEEHGYMQTVNLILKQVADDLGFLFRQN